LARDNAVMSSARTNLTRFAWLSIAAAIATIALKFGAYLLTGSVGSCPTPPSPS
jgi:divalent metal cation (Fe/Co/Zn/Cd) transporter